MPEKSPKVRCSYCSDFVAILAGSSTAISMENAFHVVAGKCKFGLLAAISRQKSTGAKDDEACRMSNAI